MTKISPQEYIQELLKRYLAGDVYIETAIIQARWPRHPTSGEELTDLPPERYEAYICWQVNQEQSSNVLAAEPLPIESLLRQHPDLLKSKENLL